MADAASPYASPPDSLRQLLMRLLKSAERLADEYGWSWPVWCRHAGVAESELRHFAQGYPRDEQACIALLEAVGLVVMRLVAEGHLEPIGGWPWTVIVCTTEHPLSWCPMKTVRCDHCGRRGQYRPHDGSGSITCNACGESRAIGSPYLDGLARALAIPAEWRVRIGSISH